MGSREGQVEEGKLIKGGYLESEESLGIDRVRTSSNSSPPQQRRHTQRALRCQLGHHKQLSFQLFMRKCRLRLLSNTR
ncbi:hypothetical protein ACFX1X_024556 [Malus domestica]